MGRRIMLVDYDTDSEWEFWVWWNSLSEYEQIMNEGV